MAEIKRIKSVRAAYKGHCTQDFKKAEQYLKSESPNHTELEALLDRLNRRGAEIADMDSQIAMTLEKDEEIEQETEAALTFQDKLSDWKFKIARFLKDTQEIPVSSFHDHSVMKVVYSHVPQLERSILN